MPSGMPASGCLYVIATPIGNLGDLSPRAAEVLGTVDLVAAEDTRRTRQLLRHLGLETPLVSFHQHSGVSKVQALTERLAAGERLAVVSDAGTPGVADPGPGLVRAAQSANVPVIPLPGPAAAVTALSASGFSGDQFTFLGYLPHKKGRQTKLASLAGLPAPVILYESPYRLTKLLGELADHYPEASVFVGREMTKLHEDYRRGSPSELADWYAAHPPKGEFVVVVGRIR